MKLGQPISGSSRSRGPSAVLVGAMLLVALGMIVPIPRASAAATGLPYAPLSSSLTLRETPLQSLTASTAPQPLGTAYVDGISDQSLPYWDGSFAGNYFADYFRDTWISGLSSHIAYARYVVQWNVMSGAYPDYLAQLDAWYADVQELGLAPEVSLASYDGVLPGSVAEYQALLTMLLARFPAIRYLEAWDEPNNTPGLPAVTAAQYTNIASSLCGPRGCTVIAGNLLDSQPNMVDYERAYEQALDPADLSNWGIHPYYAVKTHNLATVLAFRSNLPDGGAGARIWFTEIGAYECQGGGRYEVFGERSQAIDASWLVNRLMPAIEPVHVFYYEMLFRDRRPPPCGAGNSDTALFVPSDNPSAPDAPRAAAAYIYDDRATPPAVPATSATG